MNDLEVSMADIWYTVFKGKIEGRPVTIEIYDEGGGYKVHTIQGSKYPGYSHREIGSEVHLVPANDEDITIEADTKDELVVELKSENFSEKAINDVMVFIENGEELHNHS